MVSNARDDLPEPERPVKTTSESRGREMSTFRRLCSRAPRTMRWSVTLNHARRDVRQSLPLDLSPTITAAQSAGLADARLKGRTGAGQRDPAPTMMGG